MPAERYQQNALRFESASRFFFPDLDMSRYFYSAKETGNLRNLLTLGRHVADLFKCLTVTMTPGNGALDTGSESYNVTVEIENGDWGFEDFFQEPLVRDGITSRFLVAVGVRDGEFVGSSPCPVALGVHAVVGKVGRAVGAEEVFTIDILLPDVGVEERRELEMLVWPPME